MQELETRYKELLKQLHPDKFGHSSEVGSGLHGMLPVPLAVIPAVTWDSVLESCCATDTMVSLSRPSRRCLHRMRLKWSRPIPCFEILFLERSTWYVHNSNLCWSSLHSDYHSLSSCELMMAQCMFAAVSQLSLRGIDVGESAKTMTDPELLSQASFVANVHTARHLPFL